MKRLVRVACCLLAVFALVGCAELGDFFEILAYEESEDPEVRRSAEVIAQFREEREVEESLRRFADTGELRHLEAARKLRPNDTGLRAYDVVVASLGGDPAEIEATKKALALAEAQRLASLSSPSFQFETTAAQLNRNVLDEILVAQTNLLGGSLTEHWDAPGPESSPTVQQIFRDYCSTRQELLDNFDDDLDYLLRTPARREPASARTVRGAQPSPSHGHLAGPRLGDGHRPGGRRSHTP